MNEDIRSYWSAATGNREEWLMVDLGTKCNVNAAQINFAEHNTKLLGLNLSICHQYTIELLTNSKL